MRDKDELLISEGNVESVLSLLEEMVLFTMPFTGKCHTKHPGICGPLSEQSRRQPQPGWRHYTNKKTILAHALMHAAHALSTCIELVNRT